MKQRKHQKSNSRGFSLVELMIVVLIMMIVAGMALLGLRGSLPGSRANAALYQVMGTMRQARETAIAQRRNVQVRFPTNNQIQLVRIDLPAGTTVLTTITLENNMQFTLFGGVPDTPENFGNGSPTEFQGSPTMTFLSDGTFVNSIGAPLNGSIFLGMPGDPMTARAVTVLGGTGRVRGYRWNGASWIQ